MVYVAALAAVLSAYVAALRGGWAPPAGAAVLLRVRAGSVEVVRGVLERHAREHAADALRRGGVRRAYVAVDGDGRVRFSGRVPEGVRQQVRNVLAAA